LSEESEKARKGKQKGQWIMPQGSGERRTGAEKKPKIDQPACAANGGGTGTSWTLRGGIWRVRRDARKILEDPRILLDERANWKQEG